MRWINLPARPIAPAFSRRFLLAGVLCLSACTARQDAPVGLSDGIESLPPAQIQQALSQLTSTDVRQQASGLAFAERFPSLVSAHRELIDRLAASGASAPIRQQAARLLDEHQSSAPP